MERIKAIQVPAMLNDLKSSIVRVLDIMTDIGKKGIIYPMYINLGSKCPMDWVIYPALLSKLNNPRGIIKISMPTWLERRGLLKRVDIAKHWNIMERP